MIAASKLQNLMNLFLLSSQLELHRLNTGRQVRVVAANRLVKQMLFR